MTVCNHDWIQQTTPVKHNKENYSPDFKFGLLIEERDQFYSPVSLIVLFETAGCTMAGM